MLIVLIAIGIIGIITGIIMLKKMYDEVYGGATILICALILVSSIIASLVLTTELVEGRCIPEKVEMYEEENAKIEADVAIAIETYMTHEGQTMDNASKRIEPGSSLTIIAAYPELRSSELVAESIRIHNENNQKIKSLRDDLIDLRAIRWWLYFGE